ncbi:hypothetical protein [Bacillus sp. JCM 19034]|uniref:hypothetical protein n=1 Tax=Bacillus sp. JCM 19034 TaxID=1481928 RepID=UPI0007813B0A|nr:hypothetical protein [Bacillus sp. JCM 19034]
MPEFIRGHEDILIIVYCFILLWVNIGYLREHKKVKKGLQELKSEEEVNIDTNSFAVFIFVFTFNFIRRWLLYILAVLTTGSFLIAIISVVLFIISLYDILFNYQLENLKSSKVGLYLAIIDTVLIVGFVLYLFI